MELTLKAKIDQRTTKALAKIGDGLMELGEAIDQAKRLYARKGPGGSFGDYCDRHGMSRQRADRVHAAWKLEARMRPIGLNLPKIESVRRPLTSLNDEQLATAGEILKAHDGPITAKQATAAAKQAEEAIKQKEFTENLSRMFDKAMESQAALADHMWLGAEMYKRDYEAGKVTEQELRDKRVGDLTRWDMVELSDEYPPADRVRGASLDCHLMVRGREDEIELLEMAARNLNDINCLELEIRRRDGVEFGELDLMLLGVADEHHARLLAMDERERDRAIDEIFEAEWEAGCRSR